MATECDGFGDGDAGSSCGEGALALGQRQRRRRRKLVATAGSSSGRSPRTTSVASQQEDVHRRVCGRTKAKEDE